MYNLSQAKAMLKAKSEFLQKEDKDLFGKEFRELIFETSKAHKQSKELYANTVFKDPSSVSRPFWKEKRRIKANSVECIIPQTSNKIISNSKSKAAIR